MKNPIQEKVASDITNAFIGVNLYDRKDAAMGYLDQDRDLKKLLAESIGLCSVSDMFHEITGIDLGMYTRCVSRWGTTTKDGEYVTDGYVHAEVPYSMGDLEDGIARQYVFDSKTKYIGKNYGRKKPIYEHDWLKSCMILLLDKKMLDFYQTRVQNATTRGNN